MTERARITPNLARFEEQWTFPARVLPLFWNRCRMRGGNLVESGRNMFGAEHDQARRSFTSTQRAPIAGGFSFALIVKGSDGRDYDLSVESPLESGALDDQKPKLWWTWRPARTCCGSFPTAQLLTSARAWSKSGPRLEIGKFRRFGAR